MFKKNKRFLRFKSLWDIEMIRSERKHSLGKKAFARILNSNYNDGYTFLSNHNL